MRSKRDGSGDRKLGKVPPATAIHKKIIAACSQREVTPREFAEAEGLPRDTVSHHFKQLRAAGKLEVNRKESARGVQRNYYVATQQEVTTDAEFGRMSTWEQRESSAVVFLDFLRAGKAAWRAGTLDSRSDSHLSWCPFELDEEGWAELSAVSARALDLVMEIQARSQARIRASEEDPIPVVFGLFGFEGAAPEPTKTAFRARPASDT